MRIALLILTALLPVSSALATTFTVTTLSDDFTTNGNCTLREAIEAANTDTAVDACTPAGDGADVIQLQAGTYLLEDDLTGSFFLDEEGVTPTLFNRTTDLDILDLTPPQAEIEVSDVTIEGVDPDATVIQGGGGFRILHVHPQGKLTLRGVTLRGGRSFSIVDDIQPVGDGGDGAALRNEGVADLVDIVATDNRTEGYTVDQQNPAIAVNAAGGALFNSGTLRVEGCTLFANDAVGGNGGSATTGDDYVTGGGAGGGGAGLGGALYNQDGQARLVNCTLTMNSATGGRGGAGGDDEDNTITTTRGAPGGSHGGGGGIEGGGVNGNFGGGGGGGGTFVDDDGSDRLGFPGGTGGLGGGGGGSGASAAGTTDTPEAAPGGYGGGRGGVSTFVGAGGGGGGALGGAIFDRSGWVILDNVTIVDNSVTAGAAGGGGCCLSGCDCQIVAPTAGQALAAGVFSSTGTIEVRNSVIAENMGSDGEDCGGLGGGVDSLGYNLFTEGNGCAPVATDVVTSTPGLGDLADNGGSAQTIALLEGSPALHAGACTDSDGAPVTTDQRGSTRPATDPGCDIGAFESQEPDTDLDGIFDANDNCTTTPNADQANGDGDQRGDACDPCPEDDSEDDTDTDEDGIPDICDVCDAVVDDGADFDEDGVGDACDNCAYVPNANQADANDDGIGDACTTDGDGDGVPDGLDNCPEDSNADQADRDQDGVGDACAPDPVDLPPTDSDGDGVPDDDDNCPQVANPDQGEDACSTLPPDDGEGCACSAHGEVSTTWPAGLWTLAFVLLLLRRGRRRA
jgi:CSLREA domain-containing protein/MYXO-CTERM domain-containing protein